jgi:hypothetical protein
MVCFAENCVRIARDSLVTQNPPFPPLLKGGRGDFTGKGQRTEISVTFFGNNTSRS